MESGYSYPPPTCTCFYSLMRWRRGLIKQASSIHQQSAAITSMLPTTALNILEGLTTGSKMQSTGTTTTVCPSSPDGKHNFQKTKQMYVWKCSHCNKKVLSN